MATDAQWESRYDHGIRRHLDYPDLTLLDIMRNTAAERPAATAVLFKGTTISWGRLKEMSDATAAGFQAIGVRKGHRVALLLPNSPQAIISLFAIWTLGAVAVPINPLFTERELRIALNESECTTAIVLSSLYPKLKSVQTGTSLERIVVTNIKEYLRPLPKLFFTLFKEKKEGHRVNAGPGDFMLTRLTAWHAGETLPNGPRPDDPAILLFTGGTTGIPKAAIGTHGAIVRSGMQFREWFSPVLARWTDIIMMNMPLFHVIGMNGVLATGIVNQSPLCLVPNPRDIDDVVKTIRKVKPAFLPGVPTLYVALLNHPDVISGKAAMRSLKLCISAAAPLMTDTRKRFEILTCGRLVEGYSLTESMLATCMTPVAGMSKPGSVGFPLPDVEVRIVDPDDGVTPKAAGEAGEILMRAPQLMRGYWKRPAETAEVIRDGWLYTGDLGYLDDDGYLFIIDRKKDVIKTSGFQVWPREVEEVLASHPAVAEAGVAGVANGYQGESVKAWVVTRPGFHIAEEELRGWCRGRLAGYKVPKRIEFRDTLPKSPVGRVLRKDLRVAQV